MPIFLFSDIEGSTILWQKYGREMAAALVLHDSIMRQTVQDFGGEVIKHTGDGIFAVFGDGTELQMALSCALQIQRRIAAQDWGALGELRVRLALHLGEAEHHLHASWRDGGEDYFGLEVSRTQRLLSAAWGGQILLSAAMAQASLPAGASLYDHGVHLLKDLIEPQHIYELRHPDLPLQTFPALRTLSAHPHNLPPQSTPFVGRAADLSVLSQQLARPNCRLLTLIGPGGVGKTRLALQVAAEQVEQFADGVYFVPLAPLTDAGQIVSAIAEALRFTFYAREPLLGQLLRYLAGRQMLLVLDNFEHVIAGGDLVGQILQHAPRLKLLVTSRERLNRMEEELFQLQGMSLPDSVDDPQFETYSAICLFEQALLRSRGRGLARQERPQALRIGQLIDGLPLAIELACGWSRLLSLAEIVVEIERSLDFLQVAQRDRPERHRSLRAVFEYSWRLLDEAEQASLRRLSVFRGSFDRQAAQQVAGCTLLQLSGLMDKSLLRAMRPMDTETRYDLHPLIRQYAADKLVQDAKEAEQVQQRHCDWCAALAEQSARALNSSQQLLALRTLAQQYEDLHVAWQWAQTHRQEQALLQLGEALALFWLLSGRAVEGVAAFEPALTAWKEPCLLRAHLTLWQSQLLIALDRYDPARSLLEEALNLAEALAQPRLMANALFFLSAIESIRGRYAVAEDLLQRSIVQARLSGDGLAECRVVAGLGRLAWFQGQMERAQTFFETALQLARQQDVPTLVAELLDYLGVVLRDQQRYAEARHCLEESVQILRELGVQYRLPFVFNHLGGVLAYLGDDAAALQLFNESIQLGRQIGDARVVGYSLLDMVEISLPRLEESLQAEQLQESCARALQAIEIFEQMQEGIALLIAWSTLAYLRLLSGQDEDCRQALLQAMNWLQQAENLRFANNFWPVALNWLMGRSPLLTVELSAALDRLLPGWRNERTLSFLDHLDAGQMDAARQRAANLDLDQVLVRLRAALQDEGRSL
ncbi:MAG: tetratricopeptide repeat protein [Anaerolinea sp.]|nr:tetratricopeptide repeat protein [Anaerolinea sp.]